MLHGNKWIPILFSISFLYFLSQSVALFFWRCMSYDWGGEKISGCECEYDIVKRETTTATIFTPFPRVMPLSSLSSSGSLFAASLGRRLAAVRGLSSAASAAKTPDGFFTIEKEPNGVAVVTLDAPGEKVNTLSSAMLKDFDALLDTIRNDGDIKAAVLLSGKKDSFIAGADITELSKLNTAQEAAALSAQGQAALDRLEGSPKPIVAGIHGTCLGGGFELAMACSYRVATEHKKTVVGLPEVKLGLLPGAGGTQRAPRLAGAQAGLTMIMTGQNIKPKKAKRMGLVDQVADPFALRHAAVQAALGLADKSLKRKQKKKGVMGLLLEGNPVGRNMLFKKAGEMAQKQSRGNYPAIPKILECVQIGLEKGLSAGLKAEHEAFGELAVTSESKALQSIFFGSTALKKNRFGDPKRKVETLGVLGAGLMGAGIAEVSANKGYKVLLKDVKDEFVGKGVKTIRDNFDKKVKKRRMLPFDRDIIMSRVTGLSDEGGMWKPHFANCDLVIEAVPEEIGLKHKVIQELETVLPEHAIVATNTSAIPIRDIAKGSSRPQNIIGMHYFSPVPMMPLLEIITHEGTDEDVTAAAVSVGLKQGKTCIVVKDVPGFYVNRSLGPYMVEVMALLQQGVSVDNLEKAILSYGFPVGPITLLDEVGVDVAMHVQETLSADLGVRCGGADTGALKDLVDADILGRKNGKGFFLYPPAKGKKKSKRQPNPEVQNILKKYMVADAPKLDQEEIQNRLSCRFVNEAAMCLQDGIIDNPVDGDIGAIFGIGFSPFRGGPFREVDRIGAAKYVDMMKGFQDKYGDHFAPAQILVDHANNGTTFHK